MPKYMYTAVFIYLNFLNLIKVKLKLREEKIQDGQVAMAMS